MAKSKKKARPMADKVRARRQKGVGSSSTTDNPFEFKINHQKHVVLGRKLTKFDKGRPGVSRTKAINKRKETLLVEYKKQGKGNQFIDRRLGEYDQSLTTDDKMSRRMAIERKRHEKAFGTLGGEDEEEGEVLTHHGQSLAEIEKFANPRNSDPDDSDDEDEGRISAKIVGEQHFGGFLKRKQDDGGASTDKKSHRELMEEIIAKSKKAKFERQSEKEKAAELTDKLDEEWRKLGWKEFEQFRDAIKTNREEPAVKQTTASKPDQYDLTVRQLQFEAKGKPSDRLKSKEEMEREETERRNKLEAARLRRMQGPSKTKKRIVTSADALDDGFFLDADLADKGSDSDSDSDREKEKTASSTPDELKEEMEGSADKVVSADSDNDSECGAESDDIANDAASNDDESDSDSDADDPMTHLSDLEEEEEEEEEMSADEETRAVVREQKKSSDKLAVQDDKESRKKAKKSESSKVKSVKKSRGVDDGNAGDVGENTTADKKPSLVELLDEFINLTQSVFLTLPLVERLDQITRDLCELTLKMPDESAQAVLDLVLKRQRRLAPGAKSALSLDTLLLLKLVQVLFPTSDRRHAVVTPTTLYMSQLLTLNTIKSTKDIASRLFVCSLFLEYVSLSKRFVPEVINALAGVLFFAADKHTSGQHDSCNGSSMKLSSKNANLLRLADDMSGYKPDVPMRLSRVFNDKDSSYLTSNDFKVDSLLQCLHLISESAELYTSLPSYSQIFAPVVRLIGRLPLGLYPQTIKTRCQSLSEKLCEPRVYVPLVRADRKPQPLKQFTPKFREVFDGKRKRIPGGAAQAFNDAQRLRNKFKKEMKGAKREIRRDQQFLASTKLGEQMERDAERVRKTKLIMSQLANQEGEVKALRKTKRTAKK